ncbi:MAG TPA: PilZ domain-containing protein [Acidimicrobiales bacterium]|nr:PilZ domain-containing protein [Acidimicrobiales bacterium]
MSFGAAIAGPLSDGATVGLQFPSGGTCDAQVLSCTNGELVLEFVDEVGEGALDEGSVVDVLLPLSWGMYRWLGVVSSPPGERKAVVQLLDSPTFIQRRLDPRVGAMLPADVRHVSSGKRGDAHKAVVADISHGGLKLEAAKQLRSGDIVEVTMEFSVSRAGYLGPVSVVGRVVMAYPNARSEDPGITDAHVSFLEGQEKAIAAVDHFVTQQLKYRWKD